MNIIEQHIGGKICRFFESGAPSFILIQPSARHETATLQAEAESIAALSGVPFVLVTFDVDNWMVDLLPWPDNNISREEDAGKKGQATLEYVLLTLLPTLRDTYGPLSVLFGGYSLGGLLLSGLHLRRILLRQLPPPPLPSGSRTGFHMPWNTPQWQTACI